MLLNAADLLPMHESQGNTTGENPNPLGHQEWIRVGMVGNTNTTGFKELYGSGTLTGGMYVVVDQSGRPVGRMSANTIAETSDESFEPKAKLVMVKVPVTKRKKDGSTQTSYALYGAPSAYAQQELGLPAPRMTKHHGIDVLDPNDPHYGPEGSIPDATKQPFGTHTRGARTPEEAAADRAKRRDEYAAAEPIRAARRAEEEAQRRADAAAQKVIDKAAADVRQKEQRAQADRNWLESKKEWVARQIASGHAIDDKLLSGVTDGGIKMLADDLGVPVPRKIADRGNLRADIVAKIAETVTPEQAQQSAALMRAVGRWADMDAQAWQALTTAQAEERVGVMQRFLDQNHGDDLWVKVFDSLHRAYTARPGDVGNPDHVSAAVVDTALRNGRDIDVAPSTLPNLMAEFSAREPMNLAHLNVTGAGNENLFTRHLRDIPRVSMPQLPTKVDDLAPFTDLLASKGVTAKVIQVDPRSLIATQNQLDSVKTAMFYDLFRTQGWKQGSILIVSTDGGILDGHHRWAGAAALTATGHPMQVTVLQVDMPIDDLLAVAQTVSRGARAFGDETTTPA